MLKTKVLIPQKKDHYKDKNKLKLTNNLFTGFEFKVYIYNT